MGPLLIDFEGLALNDSDKELLKHPSVGGVILFSRNYCEPAQLRELIKAIRCESKNRLLITVDHEGGRVQRFRDGFTSLPPAQAYGELASLDEGKQLAFDAGWILASELLAFDIDLSFAPVLDLGHDCLAITSRAFHQDCAIATQLASAMIQGMKSAGMKTTGKHFPGHGAVIADSHLQTPIDDRAEAFVMQDMQIFTDLIQQKQLDAIMPAHVIYSNVDSLPASGSSYWLKTILREKLGFNGVIFSDDLSMEGAAYFGCYAERAKMALNAGCDLLLACNNRNGSYEILDSLNGIENSNGQHLLHHCTIDFDELRASNDWQIRHDRLVQLNEQWQSQNS